MLTVTTESVARLIRKGFLPVTNISLITGIDAETLRTETIPAICAEFGLTYCESKAVAANEAYKLASTRVAAAMKELRDAALCQARLEA